jgi:hypothetical protein
MAQPGSVTVPPQTTGPTAPPPPAGDAPKDRSFIETPEGGLQILPEGHTPQGDPSSRPEWLPQKFKSVEDMATAYAELERKIGGQKPADAPPASAPAGTPPPAGDAPKPQDQLGEFAKFTDEFSKNGKLSDESYAELATKGIPRILVDQYINNYQAAASSQNAALEAQIVASVGGPQEYAAMQVWASQSFSKDEIEAFNATMATNDQRLMAFAVGNLHARFKAQAEPRLISATSNSKPTGYGSMAEMTAAMRDPRYATDPAFRAEVAAKLKASQLFGVQQ